MSKKTKTILFSVIAAVLIICCLVAAVYAALNQQGPLWLYIVCAVACVALLVIQALGTYYIIQDMKNKEDKEKDPTLTTVATPTAPSAPVGSDPKTDLKKELDKFKKSISSTTTPTTKTTKKKKN